jgi:F-box domain
MPLLHRHTLTPIGDLGFASIKKRKRSEELSLLSPGVPVAPIEECKDNIPSALLSPGNESKRLKLIDDGLSNGTSSGSKLETEGLRAASRIPSEIWQHIFLFTSPRTLARLSRVNRRFNKLLTFDEQDNSAPLVLYGRLKHCTPDSLWGSFRKRLSTLIMPKSVRDLSERQLWALLCGIKCQFCRSSNGLEGQHVNVSQWEPGPGPSGVRIIWSFGIRSCLDCLRKATKDVRVPSTL